MCQLQIEIPADHQSSDNYKAAMVEYNQCAPLKDLQPVFLCYSAKTKQFFVSKIFQKATIENNYKSIKIIK